MIRAERPPSHEDRAEVYDQPPPRRWGRFLLLVVLAVVLVGGGAWAWLAHGKRMMSQFPGLFPGLFAGGGDGVPVVRADPTPFKIRPREPGGMEIPDRDKLVYERLQAEDAEPRVERLLPTAETPVPPPRAALAGEREQNESRAPAPQVKEALPRVPTEAQVRAAVPPPPPASVSEPKKGLALELSKAASDREPAPEDSPPTDVATAPSSPMAAPAGESQPEAAPQPPPRPMAQATPVTPVDGPTKETKEPPAPAKLESAAEPASGYLIQIAAVREPERAEAEWERLRRQHPETLRGLKLFVVRADLGDKGVFWRLRAGPFPDEAAAKNRCADLAKRRVGCLVVKAQG